MDNYMKSKEGFTLLEVLLALVILSILIVPVFNFFLQSMQYSKYNQQKTVATYAARNALVYLESVDYKAYKNFFDAHKDTDGVLNITNPVEFCSGNLFSVNFIELFPLIQPDGSILNSEEASKEKCMSIFNPNINEVDYMITLTLGEYDHSHLEAEALLYLRDRIITVDLKTIWFSGKWETDVLRGFISDEEFRYKLF